MRTQFGQLTLYTQFFRFTSEIGGKLAKWEVYGHCENLVWMQIDTTDTYINIDFTYVVSKKRVDIKNATVFIVRERIAARQISLM